VTNFCLYSVFYEYDAEEKDNTTREEHQNYIQMCRDNLETALANLNILMPATYESIMALILGVSPPFYLCSFVGYTPSGILTYKYRLCMHSKFLNHQLPGP
jgi:hypothetical protein